MYCKNYTEAKAQAIANAKSTAHPWAVFLDTSGNHRCERWFCSRHYGGFLFYPGMREPIKLVHGERGIDGLSEAMMVLESLGVGYRANFGGPLESRFPHSTYRLAIQFDRDGLTVIALDENIEGLDAEEVVFVPRFGSLEQEFVALAMCMRAKYGSKEEGDERGAERP